ncbi:hypothetical protein [Streptomyces sp. NPDC053720]|uniref:hypothetical protein n=1 Tax=Streptomyces sp. NPDC053720 TaxID=3154855 RepID=UPI00343864DD
MRVRGTKGVRRGLAAAVLAGAAAVTLSTAPAQAGGVGANATWDCEGKTGIDNDGRERTTIVCFKGPVGNRSAVSATFYAKGEHLDVTDNFGNGRATVAKLYVRGSGTATFTTGGYNLSYSENKYVELTVCTSSSVNAVCGTEAGGST